MLRSAFGELLKSRAPGKKALPTPKDLVGISIAISHTFATRVRVRILKQMAKVHRECNTDQAAYVTNYLPRPTLKIRHLNNQNKVETFLYYEAIKRFSHYLSEEFLVEEANYAKGNIGVDNLRSVFVVLSPDHVQPGILPSPATGSKRGNEHLEGVSGSQSSQPAAKKSVGFTQVKGKAGQGGKGGKGKKTANAAVPTSNQFAALLVDSPASTLERSFATGTSTNDPEKENESSPEQEEGDDSSMAE